MMLLATDADCQVCFGRTWVSLKLVLLEKTMLRFCITTACLLFLTVACGGGDDPSGRDVHGPEETTQDSFEGRDAAPQHDLGEPPDTGVADITDAADSEPVPCLTDDDCRDALAGAVDQCHHTYCDDEIGHCVVEPVADNTPCDNGDPCTLEDVCLGGVCTDGYENPCEDDNPCTSGRCVDGNCRYTNIERACDDGNPCTIGDFCEDGVCVGRPSATACPCTEDADCEEYSGDDLCRERFACEGNTCVLQPPTVCEPSDVLCKTNVCLPATGQCTLLTVEDDTPCELDEQCIDSAVCISGECVGQPGGCPCSGHGDCEQYSSDNLCEGRYLCHGGQCTFDPSTIVTCVQPESSCRESVCDPDTGQCVTLDIPDGQGCDDGNACSEGTTCTDGVCTGGELIDCDDGNPCTHNRCDYYFGCLTKPAYGDCDDGDPCTIGGRCVDGVCLSFPLDCDDGNQCTHSYCEPGEGCRHVPILGECSNDNPCTTGDTCFEGRCISGAANLCPRCVADAECEPFWDGDHCKGQLRCIEGRCRRTSPVTCTDPAPLCRQSVCDPATGACITAPQPDGTPCDDGNLCTYAGVCLGGMCVSETVNCDDGNQCTLASCSPDLGCVHVNSTSPCDNGNPCTGGDMCLHGVCRPGPNNLCPECMRDSDCAGDQPYDICNGRLRCRRGRCVMDPDSLIQCPTPSADSCLRAVCNPRTGECTEEPVSDGTACDDGSLCTKYNACLDGECVGDEIDCDDDNPCTDSFCDPAFGCRHIFNKEPCDDNNACTLSSRCLNGICQGRDPVNCDDGDQCTNSLCDPLTGDCSWVNNTELCDDGDACTVLNRCAFGECVGYPLDCDDGNPCTDNHCHPQHGCITEFNTAECDNGQPCSVDDRCNMGTCEPGTWICYEICGTGIDEDDNGLTDCDDPACRDLPMCTGIGQCEPISPLECGARVDGDLEAETATDQVSSYPNCRDGNYAGPEQAWSFFPECVGFVDVRVRLGQEVPVGTRLDVFIVPEDDMGKCIPQSRCMNYGIMRQGQAQVLFRTDVARTYFIVVDGQSGGLGDFKLELDCHCDE